MTAPDAPPDVADLGRVHLIGIGGAGMSAVAALLLARGLAVSGSDARDSAVVAALRGAGAVVHVGHDAAHVVDADTVVVSSAVRETNPELAAARSAGRRVLHRSHALAALMADRTAVAVAGAHGKTTTSAMVAVALLAAGADPSYAIGGTVLATLAGDAAPSTGPLAGARHGRGAAFVAEADESDGSFLAYRPTVAVVTNVEPDHLDHYGTRAAFEDAFAAFADRVLDGGALVACTDDAGSRRLLDDARGRLADRGVRLVGYGEGPGSDVVVSDYAPAAGRGASGSTVRLRTAHPDLVDEPGSVLAVDLELAVPGAHNALDAAAAWTAARLLGASRADVRRGLAAFAGTGRRFEDRGSAGGVRVVDDYAHHPTEVAALLRAARPVAGGGRVLVLFQPHLFSRTRTFAAEFADALALADAVVVTDVYAAREDPDPDVTGATITDRMPPGRAEFVPQRHAAAARVAALARPGDLLLTVGAGDVTELAPVVLAALAGAPDRSTR